MPVTMKKTVSCLPFILLILAYCWVPVACKKVVHEVVHKDTLIQVNQPPDYDAVSTLQLENYLNKLYIDLNGREASSTELSSGVSYLRQYHLSAAARDTLIGNLMQDVAYDNRFYALTAADFLNGADSSTVQQEYDLLVYVRQLDSLNSNTQNILYDDYEISRLQPLLTAKQDLRHGLITLHEYYYRFANNYLYDQVNMGAENFVKGSFDDLFLRAPTASELSSGEAMVNGSPATLFQQDATSKAGYLSIVTNGNEFLQGLIRKAFKQYLLRDASTAETSQGLQMLSTNFNYKEYLKTLLASDEYAGFQ